MIASHNLVELSYEEFIRHPLREVERIYSTLQLSGYSSARGDFEEYIAGQVAYIPDRYVKKAN